MNTDLSVLVVDDEVEICMLLAGILEKKGFKVVCRHNLTDARTSLGDDHFDLIFLDLNLPDGLGFHLIEEARKRFPKVKIIIISAYDSNIERKRAETEEVNFFLAKPFNRKKVWEAISGADISID